jgi:hypothetical protein
MRRRRGGGEERQSRSDDGEIALARGVAQPRPEDDEEVAQLAPRPRLFVAGAGADAPSSALNPDIACCRGIGMLPRPLAERRFTTGILPVSPFSIAVRIRRAI